VGAPLELSGEGAGLRWRLDPERVARAITQRTRALVVNTPANPTGWTASLEELQAILAQERAVHYLLMEQVQILLFLEQ
jgi:aspartate/methionine/tyrosine aminotransferase